MDCVFVPDCGSGLFSFWDRNLFSFGLSVLLEGVLLVLLPIVLRPDWRSVVGSIVDVNCFL